MSNLHTILARRCILTATVGLLHTAALPSQVQWNQALPSTRPQSRNGHAMAYDDSARQVVMFGGFLSNSLRDGETWTWDGTNWTRRSPARRPGARAGHGMASDGPGRILLFGGHDGRSYLSDSWQWDGNDWSRPNLSFSPSARANHAMAYDAARGRVVLYGGGNAGSLSDTWEWDGNSWIPRLQFSPPGARGGHAMAYDAARNRVVMFGGVIGGYGMSGDTWEWDGNTWTQKFPQHVPSARQGHVMTYDAARSRVVMYGGDVWEWDGADWIQRFPSNYPSARSQSTMVYDAARGQVVMFGGLYGLGGRRNDTWIYGPVHPGTTSTFGTGCFGSGGTPALEAVAPPWVGEPYVLRASHLGGLRNSTGFLVTGWSNTIWLRWRLPVDLRPWGWPGCSSYVSADLAQIFSGRGPVEISRGPLHASLLGLTFYDQVLVLDPWIWRGVAVSNAVESTVGAI